MERHWDKCTHPKGLQMPLLSGNEGPRWGPSTPGYWYGALPRTILQNDDDIETQNVHHHTNLSDQNKFPWFFCFSLFLVDKIWCYNTNLTRGAIPATFWLMSFHFTMPLLGYNWITLSSLQKKSIPSWNTRQSLIIKTILENTFDWSEYQKLIYSLIGIRGLIIKIDWRIVENIKLA